MCNCIIELNKQLEEYNTTLDLPLQFNIRTGEMKVKIPIPTKKLNPKIRQGPTFVVSNYCPVCGEKYPEQESKK